MRARDQPLLRRWGVTIGWGSCRYCGIVWQTYEGACIGCQKLLPCVRCDGEGVLSKHVLMGPRNVAAVLVDCDTCSGTGKLYPDGTPTWWKYSAPGVSRESRERREVPV